MKRIFGTALVILLLGVSSCGKEPVSLAYPKHVVKGSNEALREFITDYGDSLNTNTKLFFSIALGDTPIEAFLILGKDRQTMYFAKWGLTGSIKDLSMAAAVYFTLYRPLSIPGLAIGNIADAAYAPNRSTALMALHLLSHLPEKEFNPLKGALTNLFEKEPIQIPGMLARNLRERGIDKIPAIQEAPRTEKYPFCEVDSLFSKSQPVFSAVLQLPPLYQWDYFTRMDTAFAGRKQLSALFKNSFPQYASLYWRIFHYHRVKPLKNLLANQIPDTLWNLPIDIQNEILIDILDENEISNYAEQINRWLADTTITLYQKKRLLNFLPEKSPEAIFDGLYTVLDIQYLQDGALRVLTKIPSAHIDSFLIKELESGDRARIAKALYVLGFRKVLSAEKIIQKFLNSPDEMIRFNAATALERISAEKKRLNS